jgi:transposase
LEDEDARHFVRELEQLKKERAQHVVRMKSLVFLHGIRFGKIGGDFLAYLDEVRTPDGLALPPQLKQQLTREYGRLQLVSEQIAEMERQRRNAIRHSNDRRVKMIRHLQQLRGVGEVSSWKLVLELFAWREFKNRRHLGSYPGLTPTPWDSGESEREQGIDKVGNGSIRRLLIELAWQWVYLQPNSELTKWFWRRFGGSKTQRKIGIVAVARKLLIALWHYVCKGAVPKGAVVSTPA